jgi:uncharacterized membrane protein
MGFVLLILGVALWWAAHLFKRVMPARRAALGTAGKAIVAVVLVASIYLMSKGFGAAPVIDLWTPPTWMISVNNLLVLIAIYMMTPAAQKGVVLNGMRHPMTLGLGVWAIAHLLVNGDLAALVLFGGLLAWVPVQISMVNRAEPDWTPPEPGKYSMDAMFLLAAAVLMGVIGYIHGLIGPSPFPS